MKDDKDRNKLDWDKPNSRREALKRIARLSLGSVGVGLFLDKIAFGGSNPNFTYTSLYNSVYFSKWISPYYSGYNSYNSFIYPNPYRSAYSSAYQSGYSSTYHSGSYTSTYHSGYKGYPVPVIKLLLK